MATRYVDPSMGEVVDGERLDLVPIADRPSTFAMSALRLSLPALWTLDVTVRRAGQIDERVAFTIDTSTWRAETPRLETRDWTLPNIPLSSILLFGLALIVPAVGLVAIRRHGQIQPLTGAIIILALAMIATGFTIQSVQRSTAKTPGHDLSAPQPETIANAESNYNLLCLACHGPGGVGIDQMDPNHQHGSGTNLTDYQSDHLSDGDLYWRISYGIGGTDMPAYDVALTEQERWGLVHYVRHLQDTAPEPTPFR